MIKAYCTFCRTQLVPEEDHCMCPKCHARYSLVLSPMPWNYPETSGNNDVCPFVKRRSGTYWKCKLTDDYCTIPEHYHACTRYEKEVSE